MIEYVGGRMMLRKELTGWIDKDRPLLPALDADERVDYFEKRVRQVVINPVERLLGPLRQEIDGRPDSSALLVVGVAICCSIEAAGKFVTGSRGKNWEKFAAFRDRYMSPDYGLARIQGESYGDILWKYFRNGIAHGFVVCHGGFDGNGGAYFKEEEIAGRPSLLINPDKLFADFREGFDRYLGDLRSGLPQHQALRDNFDRAFRKVFVEGG